MSRHSLRSRRNGHLAGILGLLLTAPAAAADGRPNVLFLFADDQRPDTVAAFGNAHIRTPHIDRLVHDGFRFSRNYCLGSMHGAVCVPSRAMVNSGRGYFRIPMDLKGVKILPEILREAGYVTFGTGKWHNQQPAFARGFSVARAVFFGGMSDHLKVPIVDLEDDGTFTSRRPGDKFSSELFADAAVEFLETYKRDEPFYACVSFTAPHDPRMPPGEYANLYEPGKLPLPLNYRPQHPFDNGSLTVRDEQLGAWPRTPELVKAQLAEYYGMITHMDAQIGRILKALDNSGRRKNTVIIFAADHGLAMGSHGLLGKQNLYEHSMGAPLVFVGPDIPGGKSSAAFTYLLDVFPTVLGLAGISPPAGIDGHDLAPIWLGKKASHRESIFTAFAKTQRAVRDERWKLIIYPQINRAQLFDLENDPHEIHDLARDPAHGRRVAEMTELLETWQLRFGDALPLTSENPKPAAIDLTGRERKPDRHQPPDVVRKYF